MSTKDLLNKCYTRISQLPLKTKWTRNTGSLSVLKLIEKGQDALLEEAKLSQIWIGDENKGLPPYLITHDGEYEYDIIAENLTDVTEINVRAGGVSRPVRAKQVQQIFVNASRPEDYGIRGAIAATVSRYTDPATGSFHRLMISPVLFEQREARQNDVAHISFSTNPGSTTNKFFIEFTWEAPRLTTELIPLVIPEDFEDAIEDFVMSKVSENPTERLQLYQMFENYWKQKFHMRSLSGAQPHNTQVMRRYC